MQPNGGRWWQATGLGLILLTGAGLVAWAEQNDSGQNQCYDGHDMVACTEATSGDQAPHPRQDGRYGRDAQGERLTKTGGGLAGFDFTPLDAQGQPIPLLEGVPDTPPVCTRDNLTGLTWEIKTQDRGLRDQDWTYADKQTPGDPCGASLGAQGCDPAAYGAAVNAQGLCGAQDWRLPSVTELRSLVDAGGFDPALDAAYFPHSPSGPYRTATPGPSPGQSWVVHFRDGQATLAPNDQPQHLRLVRGPGAPPSSHSSTGDGTISQTPSGLIWAPCSEGQSLPGCLGQARPMTWAEALLTASGAQLAGYGDWRLPSRVELATLVDRDRQGPAIDGAHFPNTPPAPYWTSTSLMADPSQAWSIDFQDGADQAQDKQSLGYLRLVRAGTVDGLAMTDTQDSAGDDPSAPTARTGPAPVVTAANAWITGTVDDRGSVTQVRFDYGPTDRYGATITANPTSLGAGSGATAVNATLSGLSCGTLYHYRVKAENAAGTRTGEDQRFTTAACVSDGTSLTAKAQAETPVARDAAECGVNWQWANPLPQGNPLNSVVYGNGLFVAVGNAGTILTSPDGVTWTLRTSGTTNGLSSVTWSGSQFVAVGSSGTILTSPDGTTWTGRTSGTTSQLNGVTWSGSQFVAVGYYGTILTSPDGVTWTGRTSGTSNFLWGVTWSGSQFVAVGNGEWTNGSGYGPAPILTSPDGVTWTSRTSGTTNLLNGVTWSGSQFVAVGDAEWAGSGGPATILTSPDGVTWTLRTSGTTNDLRGVTWSGSQFVAVGSNGTILTSPDGVTWTLRTSGTTIQFNGVTWSGSQFVAVGSEILTSPDGVSWTTRTPGASDYLDLFSVTWSGSEFVAVGSPTMESMPIGPAKMLISLDGVVWTPSTSSKGINLLGVTGNGSRLVAVGPGGTILTSTCPAPSAPSVITNAATGVTATAATLNGALTPNGATTTASFDYGPTTSYGASIGATPGSISGSAGSTAIAASLTGLTCNSTYHYRAKGLNSAGTGLGGDQSFTTGACSSTCTPGAILVNTPTTISGPYSLSSEQSITTSASVQVQTGADVTFAAPRIQLGPGFRVALGAKFRGEARTVTCP